MIYFILSIFSLFFSNCYASPDECYVLKIRQTAGMFSVFNDVIIALEEYEKGLCGGLIIDFETDGLYYDPSRGPNWWNYYCSPIILGNTDLPKRNTGYQGVIYASNEVVRDLIKKYIHVLPHILKKVDLFVKQHFKDYFIFGVHYRGTDKIQENPLIPYESMTRNLREKINQLGHLHYKIFVATDEVAFLEYIRSEFKGKVIYRKGVHRSTTTEPVHMNIKENQYEIGEEAMIDCLLLSKTDFLFRTHSHLSCWSTLFNENLHCDLLHN